MKGVRWSLWVLVAFAALVGLFALQLSRPKNDEVKSAMVGQAVPQFALGAAVSERRPEVRLDGRRAGILAEAPGQVTFAYDAGYDGPPVSLTLPVRVEPYAHALTPHPFFLNLLREGWLLERCLASPEATGSVRAMALELLSDWRLAQTSDVFRSWLEHGAPSDDAGS